MECGGIPVRADRKNELKAVGLGVTVQVDAGEDLGVLHDRVAVYIGKPEGGVGAHGVVADRIQLVRCGVATATGGGGVGFSLRISAANTIVKVGTAAKHAIPRLVKGCNSTNEDIRLASAVALLRIDPTNQTAFDTIIGPEPETILNLIRFDIFPYKEWVNPDRADLIAVIALHAGPYAAVDIRLKLFRKEWNIFRGC